MNFPENFKWKPTGRTLGGGGQGTVYEVTERGASGGEVFALKVLADGKPQKAMSRFYKEIEVTKRLNHRSIVKVYDHSKPGDKFNFYVMDAPKEAKSLKQFMTEDYNPFYKNAKASLSLFIQLMEVIKYCGDQTPPIVHRDLSPANILVTSRL